MVLLVISCLLSFMVAAYFPDKPWRVVQVATWLWFLVPSAVISYGFAIPLDDPRFIHPASALILCGLVVQMVKGHSMVRVNAVGRAGMRLAALGVALAFGLCAMSGQGLAIWLNQWAAPMAAFALLGFSRMLSPESLRAVARTVVLAASLAAAIATIGFLGGVTSPYAEAMRATYYWFDLDVSVSRQSGTMDAPLVLAFVCSLSIFLLSSIRRASMQVGIGAVLGLGTVLSEARTATLVAAFGIAYLILQRSAGMRTRAAGLTILAVAYVGASMYGLLERVVARFQSDNGSAEARSEAWSAFFAHVDDLSLTGAGPGTSGAFAADIGLNTSFESALAAFVVEFGVIVGLLVFLGMLLLALSPLRSPSVSGVGGSRAAALLALVLIQTFSSTNTQAVVGFALWVILGMATFSPCSETDDSRAGESRIGQRRIASSHPSGRRPHL